MTFSKIHVAFFLAITTLTCNISSSPRKRYHKESITVCNGIHFTITEYCKCPDYTKDNIIETFKQEAQSQYHLSSSISVDVTIKHKPKVVGDVTLHYAATRTIKDNDENRL